MCCRAAGGEQAVTPPPVVSAEDLFFHPGRSRRPLRLVVVLRGPPGCGKSAAARKLREAELAAGAEAPRTHSIDEYFLTVPLRAPLPLFAPLQSS